MSPSTARAGDIDVSMRPVSMPPVAEFRHEALFYADDATYLGGTVPFIEAGLQAGEPVLVAVPSARVELLQDGVDTSSALLQLVSMEEMGRNPAWIIPAWADFVAPHLAAGRTARGIGEPIWRGRSDDELAECARHESLINLAFADASGFTLLCPYDTSTLPPEVIQGAHRNHPHLVHGATRTVSDGYVEPHHGQLDTGLPPLPPETATIDFDLSNLVDVRRLAEAAAGAAGLTGEQADRLLLAVSEVTSNSVRHAGGTGQLALWSEPGRVVCEVRDGGLIGDPLAGRRRPDIDEPGGRGLWLAHQVCDLVQIRTLPDGGQAVRLHVSS